LQDLNGNAVKTNIIMKKTFANLDLSQASTSFDVSLDNVTCSDKTLDVLKANVALKIGNILNMTTVDRIQIVDLNCVDGKNRITATVKLSPEKVAGRFLRNRINKHENSLDLFYILRDSSLSNDIKSRQLSTRLHGGNAVIYAGNMKIEFGSADIVRFVHNETILSKENQIRSFGIINNIAGVVQEHRNSVDESMSSLLEKMKEVHKQDLDIHERDQLTMQLLHEEELGQMRLIQENAFALHEEDQRKMQLIQENAQVLHEEEKRLLLQELEVNNMHMKEEMSMVVIEMSIIMMCCMIFVVTVLYRLRL
jgi:hypothetical protein